MNIDKLFKRASEKGLTDIQVYLSDKSNLSIEIFEDEVDSYVIADTSSMIIRGIYNNKMGTYVTEVLEDEIIDEVIDTIIASAKEIDSLDDAIIYEGDKEYRKLDDIYNEELAKLDVQTKIKTLKDMDKFLHEYDERMSVVETMYSESSNKVVLKNSKGLDLENMANSAYMGGSVIVKDDTDQRVGFDVLISNDFNDFDIKKIAKEIADDALAALGAKPVPSDQYEIVFSNSALATLFSAFQNVFSADAVQKNMSLLKDKLNEKIGSELVTIVDDPFMKKSSRSRSFDDEGVATSYKALIKEGVLNTYLHNLVTAKKDNVKSTGNGFGGSVSAVNLKMESGNSTIDEMISSMKEGIYITDVQGAHAGANAVSGDFSLQAMGYYVKNGKKERPVALITVAGNFIDMLKDITMVGNDSKMSYYGVTTPSIKVKSMPVSGS
ncbi:TldD/PmbA family protein [Hujiaoplasma nucleasis]|uniref:TldD/PmbA family protein n=1 Tax=Hujiaoplasma nucleasis TaxID=2725268 RepID=A0A7L6N4C7_9MOLU|nr:metallopeptidase TldD-related protein [Hujiaoplasma nucleasis]QLY40411.1 TldD/PmbA family protein [Hujiaoplasma nucleasis]